MSSVGAGQHQQHPPLQLMSQSRMLSIQKPPQPELSAWLRRALFLLFSLHFGEEDLGFGAGAPPRRTEAGQGLLALSPISSPCTRGAGGTEGTEAMPSTCQAHSSLSWAPGGSAGDKTSPFLCRSEPNAFKLPLHLSLDPAWFFIAQSVAPPQGQLDHFQFARKPIKLQLNVIKRP